MLPLMSFKKFFFYPLKVKPEPISNGGGVHWSDKCNYWVISSLWHVFWFTSDRGCSFKSPPCAYSITTLVYIAWPSVWGSCCRLSCYVFVCFGNGFQVAIVVYVTWWLMGKIHLLLTPPSPFCSKSHPCTPSRMNTQWEEQVPSYSPDKVTHWHPDAFLDQRAVPLNHEADLSENKVESVWLGQCSLQREDWDYMRGRFGGPSIHRPCHPMGED